MHNQFNTTRNPASLTLYTRVGREIFLPGQIIRLEAKGNYTKVYFTDRFSVLVSRVLKDFVPLLVPMGFVRTHRSHLVNKKYIAQVCNNNLIIMNDNSTADISKRKKASVFSALQLDTG